MQDSVIACLPMHSVTLTKQPDTLLTQRSYYKVCRENPVCLTPKVMFLSKDWSLLEMEKNTVKDRERVSFSFSNMNLHNHLFVYDGWLVIASDLKCHKLKWNLPACFKIQGSAAPRFVLWIYSKRAGSLTVNARSETALHKMQSWIQM